MCADVLKEAGCPAINHLPLPRALHVPGTGTSPDLHWLGRITCRVPEHAHDRNWQQNLPYRYGWFLFNRRYFWEAHEAWEAVWMHTTPNGLERKLLQCLIQISNAGLKRRQGRHDAADKILRIVDNLHDDVFPLQTTTSAETMIMGVNRQAISKIRII